MKFRWKVTLCMLSLLSVLFAVGSSALISISFQSALEREKASAREAYRMLLGTLQVVDGLEEWEDEKAVSGIVEQLSSQSVSTWSALRIFAESEILLRQGEAAEAFVDLSEHVDLDHYALSSFRDKTGRQYLQLSGAIQVGKKLLYINLGYDVSAVYEMRSRQQQAYYRIFVAMAALCAILAYGASWLLTRPMARISKASREIASGNLSGRTGIRAGDEIGRLAADFDRMAEQVEESFKELKASMERQERFIGNFTHELKTPMTSILGYADLLRGGNLTEEEQADAAGYIFSESKRLERLSLKLLDIYVTERQQVVLAPCPLSVLVDDCAAHLAPGLRKAGIELEHRSEEGVCLLEPDLIRSLLLNLVDNARKALEGGGRIEIVSELTAGGCRITVRDNGKGIPEEAKKHLTEAFYRVDKSRSRAQGGVGLGLALCENIAALHGGTIRFESEEGEGTEVIVELKGGRG